MDLPDPPPGSVERGWLDATGLPTGSEERLPVAVVAGETPGPTCWVTGGVHGNEATGVAAAQDVVATLDPGLLGGRLVCVPVVNPAGLRTTSRRSYYGDDDPNRRFPDPTGSSAIPPTTQELLAERLFDALSGADALVDLHTAQARSMPFVIQHRVLYGTERDERTARRVAEDLRRLVEAVGLPAVSHYPVDEYVERRLHRTLAGAALNAADVPACTVELGGHGVVDERYRAAGVAAVCRALVAFDLLEAVPDDVAAEDPGVEAPVDYPVRRFSGPRAGNAGVVRHRTRAGDVVAPGDVVAEIVSPTGESLETVESDHDGYVLARRRGLGKYENQAVVSLAVRDEEPLVVERP